MSKALPIHYVDTVDICSAYRSSKSVIKSPITNNLIAEYELNEPKFTESHNTAKRIVKIVEKGMLELKTFHTDGYRLSRIIFYRYLADNVYSEDEILAKLSQEGIVKTRATYQRLKQEALIALNYFIWHEGDSSKIYKNINLPKENGK